MRFVYHSLVHKSGIAKEVLSAGSPIDLPIQIELLSIWMLFDTVRCLWDALPASSIHRASTPLIDLIRHCLEVLRLLFLTLLRFNSSEFLVQDLATNCRWSLHRLQFRDALLLFTWFRCFTRLDCLDRSEHRKMLHPNSDAKLRNWVYKQV